MFSYGIIPPIFEAPSGSTIARLLTTFYGSPSGALNKPIKKDRQLLAITLTITIPRSKVKEIKMYFPGIYLYYSDITLHWLVLATGKSFSEHREM